MGTTRIAVAFETTLFAACLAIGILALGILAVIRRLQFPLLRLLSVCSFRVGSLRRIYGLAEERCSTASE